MTIQALAAGLLALVPLACRPSTQNFTVVALPDTQFYVSSMHGGTPDMFSAQTRWIARNRESLNIAFVTQLGDCVQNGDQFVSEWKEADAAMSLIEDPVVTGLTEGVPFGIAVGNHDQFPEGDADGSTRYYNEYFGAQRFRGRAYYGGHHGAVNDNNFQFFSVGRLDFIVIHLEYDLTPDPVVLRWADALLKTYSNRRGIVVTHHLIGSGNPAPFGEQGQAIYDALKRNPNLFLMLGGHIGSNGGEGQRVDTYAGNRVYSLLSDYQSRLNGGNGMLRIMRFFPDRDEILVRTFSPYANGRRGAFERDADSEFVLHYDM
jgi:hypothetical protein